MRILVVDDDSLTRSVVKSNLEDPSLRGASQKLPEVRLAASMSEAEEYLSHEAFDFAFLDIQLGSHHRTGGIELLARIRRESPTTVPIIMTSVEDLKTVQTCLQGGAAEILFKPFNYESLNLIMAKAREVQRLLRHNQSLKAQVSEQANQRTSLSTKSPKFREILEIANRAKGKDLSILILGETGAGKEEMARHLWNLENDHSRPFVAVHTGTLNPNLVESELFGHEKGAFTGASEAHIGKFEFANGGDIFLDEVATMSPDIQFKLLRVLQEKKVTRVRSNRAIPINCRIICATNANLEEMVKLGQFRQDLYYRIKGLVLKLPPLRERMEDLTDLIAHFLKKAVPGESKYLSDEAHQFCANYKWPGNIRELENALDTLAKISNGPKISLSDLQSQISSNTPDWELASESTSKENLVYGLNRESIHRNFKKLVTEFEQSLTNLALKETGSITGASDKLGIPRTTLTSKIKSWGWNLPEQMQ